MQKTRLTPRARSKRPSKKQKHDKTQVTYADLPSSSFSTSSTYSSLHPLPTKPSHKRRRLRDSETNFHRLTEVLGRKPRVLVLGGTGFVGRNFIAFLVRNDLCSLIRCASNDLPDSARLGLHAQYFESPLFEFRPSNLTLQNSVEKAFLIFDHSGAGRHRTFDLVFNCTFSMNPQRNVEEQEQISLLCAKEAALRGVRMFVQISSAEVYNGRLSTSKRENSKLKPQTKLGQSHKRIEDGLRTIADLKYVVLRPAIVYGPGDVHGPIMKRVIHAGLHQVTQTPLTAFWGRDQKLNTVHVDDLCRAMWHVVSLDPALPSGTSFNIADLSDNDQGRLNDLLNNMFGIKIKYKNKLSSAIASSHMQALVDQSNDELYGPWNILLKESGITQSHLTPVVATEYLLHRHFSVDGSAIETTGYRYHHPALTSETLAQMIQYWELQHCWPKDISLIVVPHVSVYLASLHKDITKRCDRKAYADVAFEVDDQRISAHHSILSARSPQLSHLVQLKKNEQLYDSMRDLKRIMGESSPRSSGDAPKSDSDSDSDAHMDEHPGSEVDVNSVHIQPVTVHLQGISADDLRTLLKMCYGHEELLESKSRIATIQKMVITSPADDMSLSSELDSNTDTDSDQQRKMSRKKTALLNLSSHPFMEDMSTLLNNKSSHPDICFFFGPKKKILAHKVVLAARSKYFRSLFSSGLKESLAPKVQLTLDPKEVSFQAFLTALQYLYTENDDYLFEVLRSGTIKLNSLMWISDHFGMLRLKQLIEKFIGNEVPIDADNVYVLLQNAVYTQSHQLEKLCLHYLALQVLRYGDVPSDDCDLSHSGGVRDRELHSSSPRGHSLHSSKNEIREAKERDAREKKSLEDIKSQLSALQMEEYHVDRIADSLIQDKEKYHRHLHTKLSLSAH